MAWTKPHNTTSASHQQGAGHLRSCTGQWEGKAAGAVGVRISRPVGGCNAPICSLSTASKPQGRRQEGHWPGEGVL